MLNNVFNVQENAIYIQSLYSKDSDAETISGYKYICIDFQYESIITTPDGLLIYIALMDLR